MRGLVGRPATAAAGPGGVGAPGVAPWVAAEWWLHRGSVWGGTMRGRPMRVAAESAADEQDIGGRHTWCLNGRPARSAS